MINVQELQGEWPKLRGYVNEKWGQLADDALEVQGDNCVQLADGVPQATRDSPEVIERYAGGVMSQGPWVIEETPRAVDGPALVIGRERP
jgi:hypothetical protein